MALSPTQVYAAPATSFAVSAVPPPVFTVPVLAKGRAALEAINEVRARCLCASWRYKSLLRGRLS